MKLKVLILAVMAIGVILTTPQTEAVTVDITTIMGTGIPDDGWTASTSNGIQLGLRARTAYVGGTLPNDGNGNYFGDPGFAPPPRDSQAAWNWDFSVLNEQGLLGADYYLTVDVDSSSTFVPFTIPLSLYTDNSYGTATTANSAGVEGTYALALNNTVMQNSQNIEFFPQSLFPLDPMDPGVYDFNLFAVTPGTQAGSPRLADVSMRVIIGDPSTSVPDGGATALMLSVGLLGLTSIRKFRK